MERHKVNMDILVNGEKFKDAVKARANPIAVILMLLLSLSAVGGVFWAEDKLWCDDGLMNKLDDRTPLKQMFAFVDRSLDGEPSVFFIPFGLVVGLFIIVLGGACVLLPIFVGLLLIGVFATILLPEPVDTPADSGKE
jgi:hypothetical protein